MRTALTESGISVSCTSVVSQVLVFMQCTGGQSRHTFAVECFSYFICTIIIYRKNLTYRARLLSYAFTIRFNVFFELKYGLSVLNLLAFRFCFGVVCCRLRNV